jgi:hypothetical protein
MNNETKKTSKVTSVVIVLLVLAGVPALFFLAYKVGRAKVSGTLEVRGGQSEDWALAVDGCHTSKDFIRGYKGVQIDSSERPGYHMQILRDIESKLMPMQSITIEHGPNEERSEDDDKGLARYRDDHWVIQVFSPRLKAPLRIEPEMCSRFSLDWIVEVTRQRSSGGTVDLVCELPDGGKLTARIKAKGCM